MAITRPRFPEDQIRLDLQNHYPSLTLSEDDGTWHVTGIFDLRHDGKLITKYRLCIQLPEDYPASIPLFYETGNRIPRTLDNHVNGNGTLCLGVFEQIWLDLNGCFELLPLLDRHLRTYLIGTTSMLAGKGWPYGEYAHGVDGLCEFYGAIIDNTDPLAVLKLLIMLISDHPKGHWNCPCGSSRALRKCHREPIYKLHNRRLPHAMLYNSSAVIANRIKYDPNFSQADREKSVRLLRQIREES